MRISDWSSDVCSSDLGIEFNSFGAFFSRAYRENDYLWGRLHGADRLIDIVLSALPPGQHLAPGMAATYKRQAFHAILDEEEERLTLASDLLRSLRTEDRKSTRLNASP